MPKVPSLSSQQGMSIVEALLAVTVFGMIVAAVGGAIIYGRQSTNAASNYQRAQQIAEEGIEAVRSVRNSGFAKLTAGNYGLAQVGNQWTLSGASDTTDVFQRVVTITNVDDNRRRIESKVTWNQGPRGTLETSAATLLTNWSSTIAKSWSRPTQTGSHDLPGTADAVKVATQGNYAYVVRNDSSPDFAIYDISGTSPVLVGSLNLNGSQTNIAVSGNYAFVSSTNDSSEMYTINISNPANPYLVSTFNAPGNADGRGIYTVGTVVYLVRASNGLNNELMRINVGNPILPVSLSSYSLNVTMNEVYVDGNDIYVATNSDTQEVLQFGINILGGLYLVGSVNLPGTDDALTVTGYGKTLYVGQGTSLRVINGTALTLTASLTLPGIINDIDLNADDTLAFIGTSATTGELQVVSLPTPTTPALFGSFDVSGNVAINGVSYSTALDKVVGVGSSDAAEVVLFSQN